MRTYYIQCLIGIAMKGRIGTGSPLHLRTDVLYLAVINYRGCTHHTMLHLITVFERYIGIS
jgi:hypothetical protein